MRNKQRKGMKWRGKEGSDVTTVTWRLVTRDLVSVLKRRRERYYYIQQCRDLRLSFHGQRRAFVCGRVSFPPRPRDVASVYFILLKLWMLEASAMTYRVALLAYSPRQRSASSPHRRIYDLFLVCSGSFAAVFPMLAHAGGEE